MDDFPIMSDYEIPETWMGRVALTTHYDFKRYRVIAHQRACEQIAREREREARRGDVRHDNR